MPVSAIFRVQDVPGSSKKTITGESIEEGNNANWDTVKRLATPGKDFCDT